MWPFNSRKKYPSLANAVHCGDLRAVKKMLEGGDTPDSYDTEYKAHAINLAVGRLSWETANYKESVMIIELLVNHGANVNQPLGKRMPLWIAEAGGHTQVASLLRNAGGKLRTDDDVLSLVPAKEREIRKVAREYIRQINRICPQFTKEQLIESVEGKFNIQIEPHTSGNDYVKFKEQIRHVITQEIDSLNARRASLKDR